MRTLKTREAADLLKVSPNTLRMWERKFGFPRPMRSSGQHRLYAYAEIVALRDALRSGLSVSSAISTVREGLGADMTTLVQALARFDGTAADDAMEASLALRSIERSVDEVLLPALDDIRQRHGPTSAKWAFGRRWGGDWLSRARRLAPYADLGVGVLLGDGSGELSAGTPRILALELLCLRGGLHVLSVPLSAVTDLQEVVAASQPACAVVAGGYVPDELVERWLTALRGAAGAIPLAFYLRPARSRVALPDAYVLSPVPLEAHRQMLAIVGATAGAEDAASVGEANESAQFS